MIIANLIDAVADEVQDALIMENIRLRLLSKRILAKKFVLADEST